MALNSPAIRSPLLSSPSDYCDPGVATLFRRHGLIDFETLWNVEAQDVDAPNHERGGVSTVSRLELVENDGAIKRFFLKRQTNHLARSVQRPLGEPTFSREWSAIRRYHTLGIPAVQAVWYGERKNKDVNRARSSAEWRAILVTAALEGRDDLEHWHARWETLDDDLRQQVISASAQLTRKIHANGMMHGCLFPKHLFLSHPFNASTSAMNAVIIDLEKTRRFLWKRHERLRDIYVLWRRLRHWNETEWRQFFGIYCDCSPDDSRVDQWLKRLNKRASRR
ncbi:lipopolysaccharide kinase InaA family protein [Halomonas sp. PR-M31]|uniref:lipopolysaccharide kinase InaA family protein n=1 Tax=Halomonas sp. PR-M31 TaxID=1471202 RepID=UPI0009E61AD7|nr:lipopolysaccharide kinase InaA family protein [Halomonas sp. PR-M31]